MYDYEEGQLRAAELFLYYGGNVQFTIKGVEGGYDDDGNAIVPQPETTIEGLATPVVNFKTSEVDGKTILMGDGYCFYQGDDDIAIGAQLTTGSKTYRVIASNVLSSINGITIFQKLHVRA